MKKTIEKIRSKVTFFNFFLVAILIGFSFLTVTTYCQYKYNQDIIKTFEQNQTKIEKSLMELKTNDKKAFIQNMKSSENDFMKNYYTVQSDWLNKWLTALAIIMAMMGIIIPICFVKFLENKEKEMDRIIDDTKKQKDEMQLQVDDIYTKYDEINNKAEQVSLDMEKVKNYLKEINSASVQTSKDLIEVKEYVNKMKAISKYNEGLNKLRESENDESKYDEALQLYIEANRLDPNKAIYLYAIGNLYLYRHKNNEAIDYLTKSINIEPTAKCYKDLALAHQAQKDYNKAIEFANSAINAKDSTIIFKAQMEAIKILFYSELKEKENVITYAELLLKQNVESHMIYANLGLAYMNIGEYENAIELLEKCNTKYPTQKEYYNLTEAYLYSGAYEKAWELIQTSSNDKKSKFTYIYNDDFEKWLNILNNAQPQTELITNIKDFVEQLEKREREDDE